MKECVAKFFYEDGINCKCIKTYVSYVWWLHKLVKAHWEIKINYKNGSKLYNILIFIWYSLKTIGSINIL